MKVVSRQNWLLVALAQLVLVACLGLLLRYLLVAPIEGLNYKYLLHAHSHVALLGWLYTAVMVVLLLVFLPPGLRTKKTYTWQFWLSQAAVLGMLLSFPVQGYAAASITFSTAHLLLNYWFIYQFLKDANRAGVGRFSQQLSFRFIKAALFFLAVSSLGPWSLGPVMATGHSGGSLYYNAIYFYLHFQYNGWFTFAVLGLFFWLLEQHGLGVSRKKGNLIFRLLFWSFMPAFLLSVLWTQPAAWVYWAGGASGMAQVVAVLLLLVHVWPVRQKLKLLFTGLSGGVFWLAVAAFIAKNLLQLMTALPYIADIAYRFRYLIIAYLHLVLIGFISFFLFAFMGKQGWLQLQTNKSLWGMGLFLLGFIATEALLFLQGALFWWEAGAIPYYHELLFGVSIFLPAGMLLFFMSQWKDKMQVC
ncbi:hypothetical protein [Rufibacter ruber]|uniref:hypothetical protein n=1 Tax=Rufibacter ruber TaxID=1783499 RepID=UPI000A578957|nr:hypothetical protein [Rufibacter ruber]